jgi:DNA-3-methyladenine glycosylase I
VINYSASWLQFFVALNPEHDTFMHFLGDLMSQSYCQAVRSGKLHDVHKSYHDLEYGFPLRDDAKLFERLVLEINQAGLSWETILKKKGTFQLAFDNFDLDKVAAYTDQDRERLLGNAGIIRNRLKINAAIENAKRLISIRAEYGSFLNWLEHHHPLEKPQWVKLFKKTFVFTGGEIVGEFLMSTGYLPGTHDNDCPVFVEIQKLQPAWIKSL